MTSSWNFAALLSPNSSWILAAKDFMVSEGLKYTWRTSEHITSMVFGSGPFGWEGSFSFSCLISAFNLAILSFSWAICSCNSNSLSVGVERLGHWVLGLENQNEEEEMKWKEIKSRKRSFSKQKWTLSQQEGKPHLVFKFHNQIFVIKIL